MKFQFRLIVLMTMLAIVIVGSTAAALGIITLLVLSEQTQQIGEIMTMVSEITAQSNMLALNASVEAAHVGEHGKGFAVVAAEVHNMAEQSRQATVQGEFILQNIQNATNTAVMATEEGTKVVERGIQLAIRTQAAIEQ